MSAPSSPPLTASSVTASLPPTTVLSDALSLPDEDSSSNSRKPALSIITEISEHDGSDVSYEYDYDHESPRPSPDTEDHWYCIFEDPRLPGLAPLQGPVQGMLALFYLFLSIPVDNPISSISLIS